MKKVKVFSPTYAWALGLPYFLANSEGGIVGCGRVVPDLDGGALLEISDKVRYVAVFGARLDGSPIATVSDIHLGKSAFLDSCESFGGAAEKLGFPVGSSFAQTLWTWMNGGAVVVKEDA